MITPISQMRTEAGAGLQIYTHHLIYSSQQLDEAVTNIIPTVQMRKLRHRRAKLLYS